METQKMKKVPLFALRPRGKKNDGKREEKCEESRERNVIILFSLL